MKRLFEILGRITYPLVFGVSATNLMNTIVEIYKVNTVQILIVFSYSRNVNTMQTFLMKVSVLINKAMRRSNTYVNQ
jgi:hypothetical protein